MQALSELVSNKESGLQQEATTALGETRDQRATPSLLGALTDPELEDRAAEALLDIQDPRSRQPMEQILTTLNVRIKGLEGTAGLAEQFSDQVIPGIGVAESIARLALENIQKMAQQDIDALARKRALSFKIMAYLAQEQ